MSDRRKAREGLGLSQSDAAARAGVSLASWRRWEEEPASVRTSTREACENVLNREATFATALKAEAEQFERSWEECPYLTPRQAYALASALALFADLHLGEWLRQPAAQPLHEVVPLDELDLKVMMLVGENRAWAKALAERCVAVADEIEQGVLPFDRPGCFADELLIALALSYAETQLTDEPDLFEGIAARLESEDGEWVLDDDWSAVSDAFDDRCRWDDWEVPAMRNHPLLGALLAERHPFTWFDPTPGA